MSRDKKKPAVAQTSPAQRKSKETPPEVLVITGLSGSGKTHVSRALEDSGWFCVDNLPIILIPRFADLLRDSPELKRSALVVDMRERDFVRRFPVTYQTLKRGPFRVRLLFLEADEKTLVRRFSETRRPHPLGGFNQPPIDSIREERDALRAIRKTADVIINTSQYTVHQLRDFVREHFQERSADAPFSIFVSSFGYRLGVPPEADLVFDVRCLPNPNFVPKLKPLTGQHPAIVRFLKRQPDTMSFLRHLKAFLGHIVPRYAREGKSYLTIAIGCTGGRHRSVMVANWVSEQLNSDGYSAKVRHRDILQT
jgi:UPF0042 nucleotide-binding protein